MNHIELMGAIVDTSLRYTPNGKAILDVTLAATADRGVWYQRVSMFGRMAERAADVDKGMVMHVAGRVTQERWEGKDGEKKNAVRVIANNAHVLGVDLPMEPDKRGQLLLKNGLHQMTLIANLVRDIEVREAGDKRIAAGSVAWNENRKVNDEWESKPHYFDVVAWSDNPAFDALMNRAKGDRILVNGELRTRSWEAQDGARRWKTEIVASTAFLLLRTSELQAVSTTKLDIDADPNNMPF